jgi:hypothetical protein
LGICDAIGVGPPQCNTDDQCSAVPAILPDGGPVDSGLVGRCMIAQGAFTGTCNSGTNKSPCFTQHDCQASLDCVLLVQAGRVCTSRREGAPCDGDTDCDGGFFCVDFTCSAAKGSEGQRCVTQDDCQSPLKCADVFATGNVCTSRGKGAPCYGDTDCDNGFCVGGRCDTGAVGAMCLKMDQCKVPFCVNSTCSAGAPGDHCFSDGDCQAFCAQGTCSDGKLGSPCKFGGGGCVAGLMCSRTGPLVCVPSESQDAGGQSQNDGGQ